MGIAPPAMHCRWSLLVVLVVVHHCMAAGCFREKRCASCSTKVVVVTRKCSHWATPLQLSRRAVVRLFASRSFTLSAVRAAQQSPRGTWAMALPNHLGGLLPTTNRLPGLDSRAESSQSRRAPGREQQNRTRESEFTTVVSVPDRPYRRTESPSRPTNPDRRPSRAGPRSAAETCLSGREC